MRIALLLACCLIAGACAQERPADAAPRVRPATWAQPMLGGRTGNWFRVDDRLQRSEQPDTKGMRELEASGIRTVVNLRSLHTDDDEARGTALKLVHLPCDAGDLTYDQLLAAVRAIVKADAPVLLHCWHGSDRTGAVAAGYRIAIQGWTREAAVDEMVNGGYGHHEMFDNLRTLLLGLDEAAFRQAVAAP